MHASWSCSLAEGRVIAAFVYNSWFIVIARLLSASRASEKKNQRRLLVLGRRRGDQKIRANRIEALADKVTQFCGFFSFVVWQHWVTARFWLARSRRQRTRFQTAFSRAPVHISGEKKKNLKKKKTKQKTYMRIYRIRCIFLLGARVRQTRAYFLL